MVRDYVNILKVIKVCDTCKRTNLKKKLIVDSVTTLVMPK